MTIRLISIAILSSFLFIVGCSQTQVDNIDLKTERSMNEDFPPRIPGYVEANGVQFEMEQGGFKWETKDQAVITDAASPNQIAERFEAVVLAPKTELSIQLEGQPYIIVYLWEDENRGKEVELINNRFSLPTQERYIYEVIANWSSYGSENAGGEVSYTFVIEVE